MKLLTVEGEELVDVGLEGGKDQPLKAIIAAGDVRVETTSEVSMERKDGKLIAHIRVPGKVKFDLALEKKDVKALKGMATGDVIRFMAGCFMGR